jgi:hypothetical protein
MRKVIFGGTIKIKTDMGRARMIFSVILESLKVQDNQLLLAGGSLNFKESMKKLKNLRKLMQMVLKIIILI